MKRGETRPFDPDFSPYTPALTSRPTQTHYSQHNTEACRYFNHHSVCALQHLTVHYVPLNAPHGDTGGILPMAVMSPL